MTVGSVGDPKQLRRTFVDKTDKSLKQEPLRVVYGIPSTYNAIFSRSVCKRALQIIRQEPSRTSESFPQKLSPKNLEDDIFNLFMKGPLKKCQDLPKRTPRPLRYLGQHHHARVSKRISQLGFFHCISEDR
jgi:hypothetical protein